MKIDSQILDYVARNIDKALWSSMDADRKVNHLQHLSPMAVNQGLTPRDVDAYLDGDQEVDALDSMMHETADRAREAVNGVVELFKSHEPEQLSKNGQPHLLLHLKGITLVAKIKVSNDGSQAVESILMSDDSDSELYRQLVQYRSKSATNLDRLEWLAATPMVREDEDEGEDSTMSSIDIVESSSDEDTESY